MEKVHQVFVSSTYSDLKDERRLVSEYLAKGGFIPAGMELFPASDQQQLEFIKRVIDRCDYYVVIIGGRYGSLADESVSFTEKEYEYAMEREIPVLAFLHKNPETIQVGNTDQDASKARKLQEFRQRLSTGRMVDYWENAHELCAKIVVAVGQERTRAPGVGWVRGNQAIDPAVLQELERLRIENAALQERVRELRERAEDLEFDPTLAGPDDTIQVRIRGPKNTEVRVDVSVGALFLNLFEDLLGGIYDGMANFNCGSAVASLFPDKFDVRSYTEMYMDDAIALRNQLIALGLIKTETRSGQSGARSVYWVLTENGERFGAYKKAIRKPS